MLDFRTFSGGNALTGAVENEDSDPAVGILEFKSFEICKWKGIYLVGLHLQV